MVIYADTSFLFSLYARDANSDQANRLITKRGMPLIWTALQRHELRNAFRLSNFRGEISKTECLNLIHTLEQDALNGVLIETNINWKEAYSVAEKLSNSHTQTLGSRGFDILHVAVALSLGTTEFLSFDIRQKKLAKAAKLRVTKS
jgi:predicted nucleic acid-binding protein